MKPGRKSRGAFIASVETLRLIGAKLEGVVVRIYDDAFDANPQHAVLRINSELSKAQRIKIRDYISATFVACRLNPSGLLEGSVVGID